MKITQKTVWYLLFGGIFISPFIAFLVPNSMFFPFITGKGFAFRILVEILFGLYAFLALSNPDYRPKSSWITKSVLLFIAVMFVADIFGANPYKSIWSNYERMEGFVLIAHLAMYYVVLSSVLNTRQLWERFFNTWIISSIVMSLYAVMQLAGTIVISQGGVRVDATFGNAAYLAIYLVMNIFLCVYMIFRKRGQSWPKYVYGGAIVLQTIILYFTATRGAILGIIGGILLTGLFMAWKERGNKTVRRTAYGFLAGAVLIVGVFFVLRDTSVVQNSPVLSRFSHMGIAEFKTQGRSYIWPMAVEGFLDRPILGWGQESFNFVFNKYYDPGLYGQEEWFDRTHNMVLDWLIAGGIVGLLSYISMYVALFYYIWRKKTVLELSERSVLTGMVAAYVFHNLFVFDMLISYMIFFAILAYVHSINLDRGAPDNNKNPKTFSDNTISFIAGPAILVLTLVVIYFVNIPAIGANKVLIQAITPQKNGDIEINLELFKKVFSYNSFGSTEAIEQLTQITSQMASAPNVSDESKKKFYDLTKEKLEEKISKTPHDARYMVFAGSFLNRFGQYEDAVKYLIRAVEESPKKQSIIFELGGAYLGKGDVQKAFEMFKRGYDLKPEVMESKIIYTIGAIRMKNEALKNEMFQKIPQEMSINYLTIQAK